MKNKYARLARRAKLLLCTTLLFSLIAATATAQASISYPEQAEDLVTCHQAGRLRVRVEFEAPSGPGTQLKVNFPPGITYESGSLELIGNSLELAEADLSDLNEPLFQLTGGGAESGDFIDLSLLRSGGCQARAFAIGGGIAKDSVRLLADSGIVQENSSNLNTYNILSPSLSFQYTDGPSSQDTIVEDAPQAITRRLRLIQGGLGYVSSVTHFVVVNDALQNFQLKYQGDALAPSAVRGDTLFYQLDPELIPGLFGGDGRFSNGEQIELWESFDVVACAQTQNQIKHHALWGCPDDVCQRAIPVTGTVSVIVPQPQIESGPLFSRSLPACLDGATPDQFGFFIENTGSTTARIGFQLGFEGRADLPVFGDYNSRAAFIDTASVQLLVNGEALNHPVDATHDGISKCGTPAATGAVSAARYRNLILEPSQRLEIRGNYAYCCQQPCNMNYSWPTPIARIEVRDACGQNPRLEMASHDFAEARVETAPAIICGPATVFNHQSAEYCFVFPKLGGYPNVSGDNTFVLEIGLPPLPGLQANGNAAVTGPSGTPLPFTSSGAGPGTFRMEIQQSDYEGGALAFCFEIEWSCGKGGLIQPSVDLYQNVAPSCPSSCRLPISCDAFPLLLFCPGVDCPEGGGIVDFSESERINLGRADPNNLRRWQTDAPADPAAVRLDRAAPCDTVRTQAGLGVADGSSRPWPQARFRQRLLFPFFRPLGARAEVYDNGQLIGEFEHIPLHSNSDDTLFLYELSAAALHELDPNFPADFAYDAQDSVYVEADYYFDPELAQGQMYNYRQSGFTPLTGTCVENQDVFNAFRLSKDDFATENACGSTIDRVQLIAVGATFASGGTNTFAGCEAIAFEVFSRSQRGCITGEGLDFFPNEFRPVFTFDTVAFAKIPGFAFERLEYRRSPGNVVLDISPFAEDADSLYFDLRSQYSDRGGPIPLLEENARDEILKSFWRPTCASASGEVEGSAGITYKDVACQKPYHRQQERSLSYTSTGQFNFVLNPLVGNAFEATTCYTLSATNTGVGKDFDVPFTWLKPLLPAGNISLLSIAESGGEPLSPNLNGRYELGEHTNNSTRQFEICVQQSSCLPDSLQLVYAWGCEGYPEGEAAVPNCRPDTLTAYLTPQLSEVQLQIVDQPNPAEALDLCTTDTIELLVNSAQQADLLQPALQVTLPPGIELNAMTAGYPNDASISFEPLPASISGDTAKFDLSQHSRITGDSLPGIFNSPSLAKRQMRLIFEIETGCGFDPLQSVALYQASGRSPCGAAAEGSGSVAASNPIRIKGAQAPYTTALQLETDGILLGCDAALAVQASFVPANGTTNGRDTSEVILPTGIAYLPGSLACYPPGQTHCPSLVSVDTDSLGRQIARLAWPAGMTAMDSSRFSFKLKNESAACTDAAEVIFRNTVTKAPLICMGTPCPTDLKVETGRDTLSFAVQKASLQLAPEPVACSSEDGSFRLSGSVNIGEFGLDSVQVLAFCAGPQGAPSGDAVTAATLKGPFAAGQSVSFQISGIGCSSENGLWVELRGDCSCASTGQFVPAPQLAAPLCPADTAVCLNAPPLLLSHAVPADGAYSGNGVENGRFDPAAAGVGVHTITYTLSDSLGCNSHCSYDITVHPLPSLNCPTDLQVSIEAGPQQLGGASPLGGTYAGPGISDGQFDPAVAGPGTHAINYTYTNYLGCADSCTFFITVQAGDAQIGDFVWRDLNRNGIQEAGEAGIPGVMVLLRSGGADVDTAFTDDEGYYEFTTAPGDYRLFFQTPDGLTFTQQEAGTDPALDSDPEPATGLSPAYALEEGDTVATADAGFYTLCDNIEDPGRIAADQYLCGPGNKPAKIESVELPSGGSGAVEYMWMQSKVPGPFNLQSWKMIPAATGPSYSPGPLSQTTYFARCARRENCAVFLESNIITVEVGTEAVAEIQGPDWICVGVPDVFRAMDNGPAATYEWALSPGLSPATASGAQVEVTAPNSHGAFSISLQVNQDGCTSSSTRSVTATRSPLFCAEQLPLSAEAMAAPDGKRVRLTWMTEAFLQGYQYTAEYSRGDEQPFRPIGSVQLPSALLGSQHYYQLWHETASPGANRYRLKIYSPDGRTFYSEEAKAILPEESSLARLYPNPAREEATVEILAAGSPSRQLALLHSGGKVVRQRLVGSRPQQLTLDLSGLPPGTYFIQISEGQSIRKVLPLVKR